CMLTEFRVGDCKADLAILNGTSTVYEIKSERDSLSRLQRQIEAYKKVFARIFVIAGENHVDDVLAATSQEIGVMKLSRRYQMSTVRSAADSPSRICPMTVFDSVRKSEAKQILARLNIAIPQAPNTMLHTALRERFEGLPSGPVHDAMVNVLKNSRSLTPLTELVERLPASLHAAALSVSMRRSDHDRLIAAMYHPYFRGKQYELITVRENAELLARSGFTPIIEPVKEALGGLERTLRRVCEVGGAAIVIVNPYHGDHAEDGEGISGLLQGSFLDFPGISAGILLKGDMNIARALTLYEQHDCQKMSFIHAGFGDAKALAGGLGDDLSGTRHVFFPKHDLLYRKHFASCERILLADGFKRQRNRDYPLVEPFSELHVTYTDLGMDGFGDFLIVGDEYAESGGPAYAVAIHLTFIDPDKDDAMFIYHFVSNRRDTPTDPAGKFAEALEKMINQLDAGSHVLETEAVREFRELHEKKHYPGLRDRIVPSRSTTKGRCSYCGSENVALVEPDQLAAEFSALVNIYEIDPNGKPLVEWFRTDWRLFDNPRMDDFRAKDLLASVLSNGEVVRLNFSPSPRYQSDRLDSWEQLRHELMYVNRYFPDATIDEDRLEELIAYLEVVPPVLVWYRARIQDGDQTFPIEKMGPPPPRIASHGRANPPGIPYLYLGSMESTAVAEIRPHTGELASVADFTLPADLRLVDLRDPRRLVSPFLLGDEEEIGLLRSDVAFLELLGEELTRPVLPQGAAIDYIPSQYLCEFIKKH
ncbi:hypothetical protein C7212DRAFT_349008, partial [Tuber magnatum]